MAGYAEKYYAEFRNERGEDYRLMIEQRAWSGGRKRIAFLAGCVLEIQGSQDDITAPIVKTQLRFTVIDASDMTDTAYVKYGDFSEFYTPDETLYKVSIARVVSDVATIFWTGYITPDSWQEGLGYRAPLTFTVRDNLGHLQDFTFDMTPDDNGLVCIRDLITAAKNKVDFPMTLSFNDADSGASYPNHFEYDGVSPLDAYINASLFEGEDWYSVLEETLEGIGYALRYIDGNTFCVSPLRNMPLFGNTTAAGLKALEFYGGTREYDPAVKSICDKIEYDYDEVFRPGAKVGLDFNGDHENYTWQYGDQNSGTGQSDRIVNEGMGWKTGYGFLDASSLDLTAKLRNQEGSDAGTKYPLLIANQQTPTTAQTYRTKVYSTGLTLHLVFAGPLEKKDGVTLGISKSYLRWIDLRVMYQYGNTVMFWDGEDWSPSSHTLEYEPASEIKAQYEVDIPLAESDLGVGGILIIEFVDIHFFGNDVPEYGIYARLSDISLTLNSSMLKSNKLTTINNDDYNVAVNREPRFSALSIDVPLASNKSYDNALYYYSAYQYHPYGYLGNWHGHSAQIPFPAMIHQQILAYRYGAAQVLSGNCGLASHGRVTFNNPFSYKGHKFLLKGGTLDLFTGRLASAVFHEFLYFYELWSDDTAPTTDGATEYNDGGYGSAGSSAGGGGAGGGAGAVVTWGSESGNTVPLSVNGTTKTLLKSGWSELPAVTGSDNGKVLKVVSGVWAKGDDAGYVKPSGGIPSSDMASAVQTSLGKADSALQSVPSDYKKVVQCASEAAYQAITNKDSDTLYLIPETS